MEGNFQIATIDDYIAWLELFIQHGGKVTDSYDHPFNRSHWQGRIVKVDGDFSLDGERGYYSRHIIVPDSYFFIKSDIGDNQLYCMNELDRFHPRWVPIFSDKAFKRFRKHWKPKRNRNPDPSNLTSSFYNGFGSFEGRVKADIMINRHI